MNRKKTILFSITLLIFVGGLLGYREYFRPNADIATMKPAFQVNSNGMIDEFSKNDIMATKKYLGKIVSIDGTVTKVEKDEKGYYTIVLGMQGNSSSIRCAVDTLHVAPMASLKEGQAVTVKGIFTGYNKDETGLLGSDIQLNRSALSNEK
jgi:hypothetical protein